MTKAKNTKNGIVIKGLVDTGADITISPISWHPDCHFSR